MFYELTIGVPALIVLLVYAYYRTRRIAFNALKVFSTALIYYYLYTLLIYILTGIYPEYFSWEYFTLIFFSIPATMVVLLAKIILFFRK